MIGVRKHIAVLCLLFFSTFIGARESIRLFDSTITIHKDASITVTEKITVQAEGHAIKRGIVREFPTTYKDRLGTWYVVDFKLKNVLLNGKSVPFKVESVSNGKKVFIGDRYVFIKPGIYTYTLTYQTNRQLGFFENHDELFWNVTGTGWRLPIDAVIAKVVLPQSVDPEHIKITGYTRFQGEQGTDYLIERREEDTVVFKSTRPFLPYENLTIVVGFPKGIVSEPTFLQKINWFFKDNSGLLILILGIILGLAIIWYTAFLNRKRAGDKPIIPLFYPPDNLTPGAVRYFIKKKYDNVVFASDLVNMAVQGLLTIDYQPGKAYVYGAEYTLKKKKVPGTESPYYSLFIKLFRLGDIFNISRSNTDLIEPVVKSLDEHYTTKTGEFFYHNKTSSFALVSIAFCTGLLFLFQASDKNFWLIVLIIVYSLLFSYGSSIFKSYSKKGFDLKRQLDGFKLFLSTTETERQKLIGTPPTKTPELYEKYLPYAMALGVEQEWTSQFAAVFKQFEKEYNKAYQPVWYVGPRFQPGSFSSHVGSTLNAAVAASSSRPGSGSGFGGGGGGGSGGGGGGGGGGGW